MASKIWTRIFNPKIGDKILTRAAGGNGSDIPPGLVKILMITMRGSGVFRERKDISKPKIPGLVKIRELFNKVSTRFQSASITQDNSKHSMLWRSIYLLKTLLLSSYG